MFCEIYWRQSHRASGCELKIFSVTLVYTFIITEHFRAWFCNNLVILKNVQQPCFRQSSSFIQFYMSNLNIDASIPTFKIFGWVLCLTIAFEYWVHVSYLIKRKVLIFTSNKVNFEQYTEVFDSIAVTNCQIELGKKDQIMLVETYFSYM